MQITKFTFNATSSRPTKPLRQKPVITTLDKDSVHFLGVSRKSLDVEPTRGTIKATVKFSGDKALGPIVTSTTYQAAEEIIEALTQNNIDLSNKTVLDVGTNSGINAKAMEARGADVYAVEPNLQAYNYCISQGNVSANRIFNTKVQNLPTSYHNTFDLATVFLWCINSNERKIVIKSLSKLIKQDGQVIIGIKDDIFLNNPDNIIEPLAKKYFNSICLVSLPDNVNKHLLILSEPKK